MTVLRIVADLAADDPQALAAFYRDLFDIDIAMDGGFIVTLASGGDQSPQVSVMREGGSGTPVPRLSIEVDDLDAVEAQAAKMGVALDYGPVDEPWGVRRIFLRDPAGHLVNVLMHLGRS